MAGTKDFLIDHPLDPTNKYLYHAAIESSEVLNQYSGNLVLDGKGEGQVEFPEWFAAINEDFRYQLTAVGAPGRTCTSPRRWRAAALRLAARRG